MKISKEQDNDVVGNKDTIYRLSFGIVVAVAFIIIFNMFQISQIKTNSDSQITGSAVYEDPSLGTTVDIIPKGIPEIYGRELSVNFDDVSPNTPDKADAIIRRLGALDQEITLTGQGLERYISIVSNISCEYCCGADSIIFSDGRAACGCAHSFAMRGLAKYLITNHGNEYSDEEILEELGKWKTLFFPEIMTKKAGVLQSRGIELNYVNLASNKYRGIENQDTGGEMVGGC